MTLNEGYVVIMKTSLIHFILATITNGLTFLHFFRKRRQSVSPQLICLLAVTDFVFSLFALAETIWAFVDPEIREASGNDREDTIKYDLYQRYMDASFIMTRIVIGVTTQLCVHRYIVVCHPATTISFTKYLISLLVWIVVVVAVLYGSHEISRIHADKYEDIAIILKLLLTSLPPFILSIIVTILTVVRLAEQSQRHNHKTKRIQRSVTAIILLTLTSFLLVFAGILEIIVENSQEKDDDVSSHAELSAAIYLTSLYLVYTGSWIRPLILITVGWKEISSTIRDSRFGVFRRSAVQGGGHRRVYTERTAVTVRKSTVIENPEVQA